MRGQPHQTINATNLFFALNKYLIRFNKSRGQPGRGTHKHAWRVFENGVEFLAQDVQLNVPSWGELDGEDWNIACRGTMTLLPNGVLAVINP